MDREICSISNISTHLILNKSIFKKCTFFNNHLIKAERFGLPHCEPIFPMVHTPGPIDGQCSLDLKSSCYQRECELRVWLSQEGFDDCLVLLITGREGLCDYDYISNLMVESWKERLAGQDTKVGGVILILFNCSSDFT